MKKVQIPILFNGRINYKEIGFLASYSKDEDYQIHKQKDKSDYLMVDYSLDYFSSVWIHDENQYNNFAETYKVISGGWYPKKENEDAKGRWRTLKRTTGDIKFFDVKNLKTRKSQGDIDYSFSIKKSMFSSSIKIEISSKELGVINFSCSKVDFTPSGKVLLYNLKEYIFVDFTDQLTEDGLMLK